MTQIIKYVKITVQSKYLGFIESKQKIGEGLIQEILDKLKTDNLDIKNCRAHCYDNGANMTGKCEGV